MHSTWMGGAQPSHQQLLPFPVLDVAKRGRGCAGVSAFLMDLGHSQWEPLAEPLACQMVNGSATV